MSTQSRLLSSLSEAHRAIVQRYLDRCSFEAGATILREGETTREMYLVVEGEGRLRRGDLDLGLVGPGDHVGELALVAGRPRAATLVAATPMVLDRFDGQRFRALSDEEPRAATALVEALVSTLGTQLTEMTDSVGVLLRERSVPRRTSITVTADGAAREVRTGTRVGELLPREVAGAPVVAALVDHKAVALTTPLTASAHVAPLSTAHWEGERIVRESTVLLLLEAASEIPQLQVRVTATMGNAIWLELGGCASPHGIVDRLRAKMNELVERDATFREEWWTLEEARSHFLETGGRAAFELLRTWRESTVPMVSCGRFQAIRAGAMVPSARMLRRFSLAPTAEGAVLIAGEPPVGFEPERSTWAEIMRDHARWLAGLGVTSVGAFNRSCVDGGVSETIRVAEGFHEKRLARIADLIAEREGRVRVVCIAGPSSSGKTTFIKRLKVHLALVGIHPVAVSLDDYYVDREKTVRGPDGEYDFEALEALDLNLLGDHLRRMLRGEAVRTARYDFVTGKSHPSGGPEIALGAHRVLMVEGIHGLNPKLLGDTVPHAHTFKIFIQPMTSLPFDEASRLGAADLRLLRRIVRDRRGRGCTPGDNIMRWPSVRRGERLHIFPFVDQADVVFDTSLVYELSVLKTYAERYLLEVPEDHPAQPTASRLRQLVDRFVAIHAAHVPPTSILREFIGESAFEY